IGFRAEGGPGIGMGHIMRCLTLAQEFKASGHEVIFISNHRDGRETVTDAGFRTVTTGHGQESEAIAAIITSQHLDCLIVDSYRVDRDYFHRLKSILRLLCYIDDLNRFIYPVDILINGNFGAETWGYQKYEPDEVLLLGTRYNLIRKEFQNLSPAQLKTAVSRILITMGAADPVNFSARLIHGLRQDRTLDSVTLDVVVGPSNPFDCELQELSKSYPNIRLHHQVRRMSELMLQADLAISAGGSTLYELCVCGVPTSAVIIADNQEFLVTGLTRSGYIKSLGWHDQVDFGKLSESIRNVDISERWSLAAKGRKLIDGYGPGRVRQGIEIALGKRRRVNFEV
ncbi:MAG TPA: UDP-2,4-diacetamido-2,4,6-trideoxy-beta-L-altropyranose hydrolase, partial [Bacillota bacterium]